MSTTSYDQIAGRFNEDRTQLCPGELEYLALLLEPLSAPATILDLGCGTGNPIATYLAARGHRVVGVDGSEAMLALARERLPGHRWIHDLIERVEFTETFSGAICWDSLFHLPRRDYQPVLTKIHRWLAPGGRVMVSSGGEHDATRNPAGFTDTMYGHQFYYDSPTPAQMVATMEDVGFKILVAEMCDPPDGARNKGKWATVAAKI
jgi:ubiquinone/menaquinone biosynthesis C-methylase UbiE